MPRLRVLSLVASSLLFPVSLLETGRHVEAATCIGTYTDTAGGSPYIIDSLSGADGNGSASGVSVTNSACGTGAIAAGSNNANTAIGDDTRAGNAAFTNTGNTALGSNAKAGAATNSNNNLAVGINSVAEGGSSVAIGSGANAGFAGSVAIGPGATATRANQIVVGTAGNSYTLPGLASNNTFIGTGIQAGSIQFVTVDGSGNLGTNNFSPTAVNNSINSINTSIGTINSSISTINGSISTINNRLDTVENSLKTVNSQIENVGAMAAALSSLPNFTSENRKYGCGIGSGVYGSGWAGAAGCAGKVASNVWLNGAVAFTGANSTPWGSTSSVAGRVGLFLQWGGSKP